MNEYGDTQSIRNLFIIVLVLFGMAAITLGIVTIPHLLKGEKQICEKEYETVCYKAVGGLGSDYLKVDCNSNNVDRTKREVKEETCQWVKKALQSEVHEQ